MEIKAIYELYKTSNSVCTDTRKLKQGDLYFALKGEHFDGNQFAEKALQNGANYCIIDDKNLAFKSDKFILVDDVLQTLQDLARYHRRTLKIVIVALTGSNGKTTTKELIHSVLSTHFNVKATEGNFNNHIGVPLTLLSFNDSHEIGIVEMGANHQKEIAFLCSIAEPDYGLITNFGKAHLEGFGGEEGIIKGKSELYDYIKANDKFIFLNVDDPKQVKQVGDYDKVITFGQSLDSNARILFNSANPFVSVTFKDKIIRSQLIGHYNFNNIAIAIAIGKHSRLPVNDIKRGIESYHPTNNRSQIITKGSNKIILDAYNANPTSMMAALENFKQLESKYKICILGDMFELGEASAREHQAIIDYLDFNFSENTFVVGKHFYETTPNSCIRMYKTFEDLKIELKRIKIENASILIKGSRGMALERILDII